MKYGVAVASPREAMRSDILSARIVDTGSKRLTAASRIQNGSQSRSNRKGGALDGCKRNMTLVSWCWSVQDGEGPFSLSAGIGPSKLSNYTQSCNDPCAVSRHGINSM